MSNKRILSCNDSSENVKRQKGEQEDQDPCKIMTTDEDLGHLICHPGEVIMEKYKILNVLGEGQFGRVVLVNDIKTSRNLALKIIRKKEKCRTDGILEIMALADILYRDKKRTSLCIEMLTSFEYEGHICIGFEALGVSVLQFLEENNFVPFPLNQVRHIGYQLCHAVNFLHSNGITHTDLKPDNFLFIDSTSTEYWSSYMNNYIQVVKRSDIRLIDFGQVVFNEDCHKSTISNRFYRAPEVVLNLRWSQTVDVWSIGCILYELFMGDVLFVTSDNDLEHLAVMEKLLGTIPRTLAERTRKRFFTKGKLNFLWTEVHGMKDSFMPISRWMQSENEEHRELFDLIIRMLQYEPSQRITLEDALMHPFFKKLPLYQQFVN